MRTNDANVPRRNATGDEATDVFIVEKLSELLKIQQRREEQEKEAERTEAEEGGSRARSALDGMSSPSVSLLFVSRGDTGSSLVTNRKYCSWSRRSSCKQIGVKRQGRISSCRSIPERP
jgi:hypothetical protein